MVFYCFQQYFSYISSHYTCLTWVSPVLGVVYIWGFWVSFFPQFPPIFPHFFLNLKSRTTFLNLLNILKNNIFKRYIIQLLHHHMIYLTNSYKSSQLNSISLKSSTLYPTSKKHIHHQCAQSKQLTIYQKSFCLISISFIIQSQHMVS